MFAAMVRMSVSIIAMISLFGTQAACDSTEKTSTPDPGVATDRPVKQIEFSSGSQLEQLINELNYTPEAWLAGVRELPRLYITNIPPRWRDKTSKELDVVTKKRIFFRLIGPLALHSNELIQADRDRLLLIIKKLRAETPVSSDDQTFLRETAAVYKVIEREADLTDHSLHDKLLRRVDTLPPSLVLAQAAEESGWGTSRFAAAGNALFGMWTWDGKGVMPLQQRSELGNYKIASFETPLQSVIAYMHNLNTHQAYRALRVRRAELRKADTKVTGWELAKTLIKYSERGQKYVDSLHSLIKGNKLQPTDDAYLGDGPTILLIPVGEGAY